MTASNAATPFSPDRMVPPFVVQQLALGQELQTQERLDEAIAAYRSGLAAIGDGANQVAITTKAALHARLGNAYMARGDLALAGASYTAALRIAPNMIGCWCNLANVQMQSGHAQDAIPLYLQAIKLSPSHWPARTNLAQALMATGQMVVAKALLNELAAERPDDAQVQHQLGKASFELNEVDAALEHFNKAVALDPGNAESLYWIGGIRQQQGDAAAAQATYAAAAQIQPLIRKRAIKSPADFRVLALYAPFGGNTPMEYLFKDVGYDTDTLALFDTSKPDLSSLGSFDLVINLISDADQSEAVLPLAAHLAAQAGKPVINDPAKISHTTRDAITALLSEIPGCRIPHILRLPADKDVSAVVREAESRFSFPLLVRPAGTHGGDDFEKCADGAALAGFLKPRHGDHYLIQYIDYASADGHFRKYRFIFVGEKMMPYHLCIGNEWKVHHVSTDMAHHAWMQQEEAAFLAAPGAVFSPAHYRTLNAIRERIGLDYFGIDCALDREGNVVVFEVNASMLVHARNEDFPYKDPYVRAIKDAFDAMLHERAGKAF
ncbi:MAG: tetratricopeptide repeat protein [Bradyrhizobium sp.]|nr:tetratricopeptide repeat protein [Bradyrhizobium sp.]